jgi:hypothetical protein
MRRKDLDLLIVRWKKSARALKIPEQPYGNYVTDLLERRTDAELALFSDPVEVAVFFCLLGLMKQDRPEEDGRGTFHSSGIPGQATLDGAASP